MAKIGDSFDNLKKDLQNLKVKTPNNLSNPLDQPSDAGIDKKLKNKNTKNNTGKNTSKETEENTNKVNDINTNKNTNKEININTNKENNKNTEKENNKNTNIANDEILITKNSTQNSTNKQKTNKEETLITLNEVDKKAQNKQSIDELIDSIINENVENTGLVNRSYLLPREMIREIDKLSYKFDTKKGDMVQKMLQISIEILKNK